MSPIGLLDAEILAEAVLLYVFNIAFPASYLAVTALQIQHHLGLTLSSKVLHTLEG